MTVEVEAAAQTLYYHGEPSGEGKAFDEIAEVYQAMFRSFARVALEAAEEEREGENDE